MALTTNEMALCNSMVGGYMGLVAPAKMAKSTMRGYRNAFENKLRNMVWSADGPLNDAIDSLQSTASLPDTSILSDVAALKSFLERCSYLSSMSPVAAMINAMDSAYRGVDGQVQNYSVDLPEFGAANIANQIDKLLNGLGIPGGSTIADALKQADKLLNCLHYACAAADPSYYGSVSSISYDLDTLYNDLNVNSDPLSSNYGKYNYESTYTGLDLSYEEYQKIEKSRLSIITAQSNIDESYGSAITNLKSYMKGGFF